MRGTGTMIDGLREYVEEVTKLDAIAVVIQASDGTQYVVDLRHFAKMGRAMTVRKRFETPARAAARIMKAFHPAIKVGDYEVFKPRALGAKRTYFVVWFAPTDFKADAHCWNVDHLPEQANRTFSVGQLHALKSICIKAQELHSGRMATEAA